MRALSESEANEVLKATFDPSVSFSSGALGGNQTLGGKFANARSRAPMDDAQFGKVFDDALLLSGRIFRWLQAKGDCLAQSPADLGCSAEQLKHFARLLWRSNVMDENVAPIVASFAANANAWGTEEAVQQAFTAMLVSPEFLYRFEFGRPTTDGTVELSPIELAESLAFFVTGRPPSLALMQAAESAGATGRLQALRNVGRRAHPVAEVDGVLDADTKGSLAKRCHVFVAARGAARDAAQNADARAAVAVATAADELFTQAMLHHAAFTFGAVLI